MKAGQGELRRCNDPWRAVLSWHRSSACCGPVELMLFWRVSSHWLVFSVYLTVLSQGTSLNVSAERLPIKAGGSLFCISAHFTNIFTFLEHCFPWISTPVYNSCSADPSKATSAEGLRSLCTASLPGSAGLCSDLL